MKTRNTRKGSSFTTRQGVFLTLAIGVFFALVFVLAYYLQAKSGQLL